MNAQAVLEKCTSKYGFLASATNKDNYKRVFARDGVIIGLAALLTKERKFIDTFRRTLETLAQFQGEHGEIPSNVDVENNKVSFGQTAGRVDATLWFVIGMGEYLRRTKDEEFVRRYLPQIRKLIFLLGCWEFNQKGFIYSPQGGDWADEYINAGYVLYNQLLYYKALLSYKFIENNVLDLEDKILKLKNMINANFWPTEVNKFIYHDSIFRFLRARKEQDFYISSFTPGAYVRTFDSFANALAILFGIADEERADKIINYVETNFWGMIPAFFPPICEEDPEWRLLQSNYSFCFKNFPGNYHNGGLWPLTTGLMIAAMRKVGRQDLAEYYFNVLTNFISKGFYEYFDADTYEPKGVENLGMSAAGLIFAHYD